MTIRILNGDVRAMLATLPDESVHCIWTSPPYWGLRTYHTEPQIWRAPLLSECDGKDFHHIWGPKNWITGGSGVQGKNSERWNRQNVKSQELNRERGEFCQLCGSWRGEHGSEPSLQLWLHHEVLIWRDLRRVLRKDGVAWLNIGDAYANDGKWGGETGGKQAHLDDDNRKRVGREKRSTGLKPKDRMLMPARLAIALQDDGWWVRDEVIWAKPNPMPESVTDRCTKAHEFLFLLTKGERYFYDADAIKEPASYDPSDTKTPDGWDTSSGAGGHGSFHREGREKGRKSGMKIAETAYPTRNKRSVWSIPSEPFPEAHFATAPAKLIEPCILAGCPKGGMVLDPFLGSGTTAVVADRLQRDCIGIELNPEYIEMARRRIGGETPLLTEIKVA